LAISKRENYLRTASMTDPEWIPCQIGITAGTWRTYGQEMERVVLHYPRLFPDYRPGQYAELATLPPDQQAGARIRDNWGCELLSTMDGVSGQVVDHPLDDWAKLADWCPPDPLTQAERGPMDWDAQRTHIAKAKADGELAVGWLCHGFLFLKLVDLRGFDSFMMDVADAPPELQQLIDMIVGYYKTIIDAVASAMEQFTTWWWDGRRPASALT